MRYASFNINYDSLGEMYGFPADYRDVSFLEVSKRFLKLADEYGFKYSLYVIGKDLEKPENQRCVKEWVDQGHEIGNHSWSHPLNLGSLTPSMIREEVERAHEIITRVTGKEPRGFIAPGWATSDALMETLLEMKYLYDTSSFPSWISYLSMIKMFMIHFGGTRMKRIFHRRDYAYPFVGSRRPYLFTGKNTGSTKQTNALLILPLPTNAMRIACWHTLVFVIGKSLYTRLLDSCLEDVNEFYYLLHPGDLLDIRDIDPSRQLRMERLKPGLQKKEQLMRFCMERVLHSGRQIVTMERMASDLVREGIKPEKR